MDNMKSYLDTPVFLTFFVKHDTLRKVFARIREVKPRILFLVGDGPRKDHLDDIENVRKCRKIVENIDWECEVYRYYQDENTGILYNSNYGLINAFKIVDRLIFLEDDKLPSKSFFYFCDELLEKYKDDQRIYAIAGGNHCGIYKNCKADYFFARSPYSGAVGMWKRSYEAHDREFAFLEDNYIKNCVKMLLPKERRNLISRAIVARRDFLEDGMPKSNELITLLEFYLQNRCYLYPKRNMVVELGCVEGSEHFPDDIRKVPRVYQKAIMSKSYEFKGSLKHPKYVVVDKAFEDELMKRGIGSSIIKEILVKAETFIRLWVYGSFDEAMAKLKKYALRKLRNRTDKNGL